MFCLCFFISEVISSCSSLRDGSQVFALLMLSLCVILYTMSCNCYASLSLVCCACLSSV